MPPKQQVPQVPRPDTKIDKWDITPREFYRDLDVHIAKTYPEIFEDHDRYPELWEPIVSRRKATPESLLQEYVAELRLRSLVFNAGPQEAAAVIGKAYYARLTNLKGNRPRDESKMLQSVEIHYAYRKLLAAKKSNSEVQIGRPEPGPRKFATWKTTLQGFYETFHDQFQRIYPRFSVPPMSEAFFEGRNAFDNIAAVANSKDGRDMVEVSRALGKIYIDRVYHLHGQGNVPAGGGGGLDKSL